MLTALCVAAAGRSGRRFAAAMGLINELLEAQPRHTLRQATETLIAV